MNDTTLADLQAAVVASAEDYRRQIVAARCSSSSEAYERNNGRAESTRVITTRMAEAAGLPVPDWDAIRSAVPHDGIYRAEAS